MAKVLVTGGCGYIGSHTIVDLIQKGYEVISVDSGINSDFRALDGIKEITGKEVRNYDIDLCDFNASKSMFESENGFDAIIHFAALKAVGDSVKEPIHYFKNNLNSLLNVLDLCQAFGTKHFIFSSSCTVYGNPDQTPVVENTSWKEAESPYGRTKQMGEQIILDSLSSLNMTTVMLRYFNPAGAHISGKIGESPMNKAQNLVPVITETAIGKRSEMTVFGGDYDTRDGSCIRDYIHVMDLAEAHTKALQFLESGKSNSNYETFNLGIGEGVSVFEAIKAFETITGQKLNYSVGERRSGDVVSIYADYSKAKTVLGWEPKRKIEDIMQTAWAWEKKRN